VEAALAQREAQITTVVSQKDEEIARLTSLLVLADQRVKDAVAAREEELRLAVIRREEEVATAMAKREEEIMQAVNKRDEEIGELWRQREEQLRAELDDGVKWVLERQKELESEAERLENARKELEKEASEVARRRVELEAAEMAAKENATRSTSNKKDKSPFEEVKNLLAPFSRLAHSEATAYEAERSPTKTDKDKESEYAQKLSVLDTPISRPTFKFPLATPGPSLPSVDTTSSLSAYRNIVPGSAMRGVILTATGQPLETPRAMELSRIIKESPKVGLNFKKIFDFEESEDDASDGEEGCDALETRSSHTQTDVDDNDTQTSLKSAQSHSSLDSNKRPASVSSGSGSTGSIRSRPASPSKPTSPVKPSRTARREKSKSVDIRVTPAAQMPAANPRLLSKAKSTAKSHTPAQAPSRPSSALGNNGSGPSKTTNGAHPTRLRRPSITARPTVARAATTIPASTSCPTGVDSSAGTSNTKEARARELLRTHSATNSSAGVPPTPKYDPNDDENLPSPFLRRVEKVSTEKEKGVKSTSVASSNISSGTVPKGTGLTAANGRRRSNGNVLRAIAAANSANALNAMMAQGGIAASPSPAGPKMVS
jgi:NIMA (never in mitosis gene a)-related kinase